MKKIMKFTAFILVAAAATMSVRSLAAQAVAAPAAVTEKYACLNADGQAFYCGLENACSSNNTFFVCPMDLLCILPPNQKLQEQRIMAITTYGEDHPEKMRLKNVTCFQIPLMGLMVGVINYDSEITEEQESQGLATAEQLCRSLEKLSEGEQVWTLYQLLTSSVTYCADDSIDHTMYGAVVEGEACCEGIAKAMSWCLSRLGIENQIIRATMPSGNGHVWNSVKLDGDWYELDPTWDLGWEPECWKYYMVEHLHPDALRKFVN